MRQHEAPMRRPLWNVRRVAWGVVCGLLLAISPRPAQCNEPTHDRDNGRNTGADVTGAAADVATASGKSRPRIGLALGGGAARGLAHVGVLKVLHEMRVPIDLVAGTSMGAIVGGLHALGHAPAQTETVIRNIDWGDLFSDQPDRMQRSFRRKEDSRSQFLDFEFGIRGGKLRLPRSFIAGQKLTFAFEDPALHTAGLASFDSLVVPFRAVATDLRTGEMVVFEHGSLARALRASMSVPGFFAPVELRGRLLVDGGVVRNLPVDVARDMGADVVIAVDVSEDLGARSAEELASLLGFSFQLTTLVIKVNTDPVLPLADVVVSPDLGDLSIIEFDRAEEAIRAGERATRAAAEALREYALSEADYAAFLAGRRSLPNHPVRVDSIELANKSRVDDRAIRARLTVRQGDPLDFERLRHDLADIYDLGSLERVDFDLHISSSDVGSAHGTQRPGTGNLARAVPRHLRLHLNEKTYAPNLMHVGLWMSSEVRGRTRVQALARLTRVEANRLGAEWRNDFRVGAENSVRSEWFQPVEFKRHWFTALQIGYAQSFQDLYSNEERVAEYGVQDAQAILDVGVQVGRFGELRSGLFTGWVKTSLRAGDGFPEDEGGQGGWRLRFAVDRLDDADFPRRGQLGQFDLQLSRRALGSRSRFDRMRASGQHFSTWGELTLFAGGEVGTALGTDLPPHEEFRLGGLGSLSGLREDELRGDVYGAARVGAYRTILRDVDIVGTDLYGAAWFEAGSVWPDNRSVTFADLLHTWTLALGADTVLGPVYLAYGRTHEGDDTIFVTVGRQIGMD